MTQDSIFRLPVLIGYLVKQLKAKYPEKQVGKTVVQKMVYLFTLKNTNVNLNYSMYHYGPYSSEVSSEMNFAEISGLIKMKWVNSQGYDIEPADGLRKLEFLLEEQEMREISNIVDRFGQYNAVELSIIATACFLKNNFRVPISKLADAVSHFKPGYSSRYIKKLLREVMDYLEKEDL